LIVIGDIIIDEYIFGETTRISPEAPVPVVNVTRREERPGGAANVSQNLKFLGVKHTLIGSTPLKKTRIICQGQQLLRIDQNDTAEPIESCPDDNIIFSDYGKGSLKNVQQFISQSTGFTFVDPKGSFEKYAGCTLLKPNLQEFREVTQGDIVDEANYIRKELNIRAICVTMGKDGMILIDDEITHWQSVTHEVYDVTGAGDTVIAVMAAAITEGKTFKEAAGLANMAAGIVVQRLGTSTVTRDEIDFH